MPDDGKTAQHRVPELMSPQKTGRRHHPAHPQRGAQFLGVSTASRSRTDDFLQRDDVRLERAQYGGDSLGPRSTVHAARPMDVVGRDADRARVPRNHYVMIGRMRVVLSGAVLALLVAACSTPPVDPIQLDRNILTVDNRTEQEWSHVEIWLNSYFRVVPGSIPAGGRFQAPLDTFISGFGRRFDFRRMQIKDVRLTATLPDGRPLELKKAPQAPGLAGALGGKQ